MIIVFFVCGTEVQAGEDTGQQPFSFVVLGHVRGNDDGILQPLLDPLLAKVYKRKPDMIFLTGDMIWGGLGKARQEPEVIIRDWDQLDAVLAKLNVPIYRVPGNHDIHDSITRDIYFARYGMLPQAFTYRGSRFLLLNSSYVPAAGNLLGKTLVGGRQPYLRGKQLDPEQLDFIRKEVTKEQQHVHVFIFMHHVLWDNDEKATWWQDVHPLLAGRTVRAVFAGDVGPRKFSHLKRDGIDYIQSSMADIQMEYLQRYWRHRMIAQQFDNYLYVAVDGQRVAIEVETIGALSGQFTPDSWREMLRFEAPPVKPLYLRVWDVIGSPMRLTALLLVLTICFLCGVAVTLFWCRRRGV